MTSSGNIYVENITDVLAGTGTFSVAYTSLRVYRGSTSDPNTAVFTTLVQTIPLVADQEQYTFDDASGTVNTIWRAWYYNTGTTANSALGPIIRADQENTLLRLRIESAIEAGVGFAGVCSALGTTTTLIDAALRDEGIDTAFLEGAYIYRPDAAAAGDRVRQVKKDGFTVASGTLGIDRQWTNAPADAEVYHIFGLVPPIDRPGRAYSWDRACRDGLLEVMFPDDVILGDGDNSETRFSFAPHLGFVEEGYIRRVFLRFTNATTGVITDVDANTQQRFWKPVQNGPGSLSVDLWPPPVTDWVVWASVSRTDADLYTDTDVTAAPFVQAIRATVWKLFEQLNGMDKGKYAAEEAIARRRFLDAYGGPRQPAAVKGL